MDIARDVVRFGVSIQLADFEGLASEHLRRNPTTPEIESTGSSLIDAGFPESETKSFVREVCAWGGYAGVGGRTLKLNEATVISGALREAHRILSTDPPEIAEALRAVNCVKTLGAPSFASKHLRFLAPQLCPVFDAYLQQILPYSDDPSGYAAFAADCSSLASHLTSASAQNPWPNRDRWYAADAEAAIYVWASDHRSG